MIWPVEYHDKLFQAVDRLLNTRGTDKPLFGVFKQLNLLKKQLFSNEGVTKSNFIMEKSNCFLNGGVTKSNLILEKAPPPPPPPPKLK